MPETPPPSPAIADWTRLTTPQKTALAALGLKSVAELLHHLPRRHEDRRHASAFPTTASSLPVSLDAMVIDTRLLRFGRAKSIFEATLVPARGGEGGKLVARWFNLSWMQKAIAGGDRLFAYGKVKAVKDRLIIDHPEIEVLEPDDTSITTIHVGRIVPIYPLATGIKQKFLRSLIHRALGEISSSEVATSFPPLLPSRCAKEAEAVLGHSPSDAFSSLRALHFPESEEELAAASREFALGAFFRLQLAVAHRRRARDSAPGQARCGRGVLLAELAKGFPFDMTEAQKRTVREIRADLKRSSPMRRLLQGDVGSGKTAVAMAAIALAIESGCQAAVMAPTQILAEQHFRTFSRQFSPLGCTVALRTGARVEATPDGTRPDIVIGTHALLFAKARDLLVEPGLIVIDEQHKFGVAQRARLMDFGTAPHVLVMTATPIPRTLTMTLYGDLDVSVLDELPPGRGEIVTAIRIAPDKRRVTKFVREQLALGRQTYIVHPLVEESEKQDAADATSGWQDWQRRLPGHTTAILTGRTPPEEKEGIMTRFREGEIHVLVTTTVIEVGVDVPNATVMLIEDAGRFGLAQLHQLRGRVGRGAHKSYCLLLLGKDDTEHAGRLEIFTRTRDGFAIAEEDLRQRGPGDVLGTEQSGLPGLEAPALERITDTRLIAAARRLADLTLDSDPNLSLPEHQPWKACLERDVDFSHVG
ncbi:MAG: ATP-dependent DNA helicase RecG [Verrucomicrobiales bacterium]